MKKSFLVLISMVALLVVGSPVLAVAPQAPVNLTTAVNSPTSITVFWTAPTFFSGVAFGNVATGTGMARPRVVVAAAESF